MAVVASWDGANRRIYLASGVTEFHPIDDIYREYRTARRTDESLRVWDPFMVAVGNQPKGGGKFTPRYLLLLSDDPVNVGPVKIICFDEATTITVTGEVLADDQTDPFDYSTRVQPIVVRYQPAEAELVAVGTSGLTEAESTKLDEIHGWSYLAHIWNKVALFGRKITKRSTDPVGTGGQGLPGTMEVYDPDTETLFANGDIWEDEGAKIGYRGRGIDREDTLS